MAETKNKTDNEREHIIPLRKEWRKVPRYKRANKAVKAVKEFLARHMKIRDRDLNKIKIDTSLNEIIWFRGIKKPLAKVKVKAVKEGEIVRVSASELPEKIKFKEAGRDKREKRAVELAESKKSLMQKAKEGIKSGATPKSLEENKEEDEQKKVEEKEKKSAVVESNEKIEKEEFKKMKHQTKTKKQTQVRKVLDR